MNFRPDSRIFADRRALATALSSHVAQAAQASSVARGRFCVALSGGSLMDMLAPALCAPPLRDHIDWSAWHVFWVDERWVPPSSPDSNSGLARRLLFSRVGIPEQHIHAVDDSKSPDETARAYEVKIRRTLPVETGALPRFDMVLLGLGEDGHTASLFPGHPALQESRRWVVPVFDAPKPPPVRVTMTLPVINAARRVVFVAAGSGKSGVVAEVLHPSGGRPNLPARMVKPTDGELHWFVDQDAAGVSNLAPVGDQSSMTGKEGSRLR
ncbi:MAG: 6-phosphogluconolactonase [Desulfosarcina sp.]